jgi:hypothetical protein
MSADKMLCEKCLHIELAERAGQELTYQLSESMQLLRESACAGCEGCQFFESMIGRYQWYFSDADCPTPPEPEQAVELQSRVNERGYFGDLMVYAKGSSWSMELEAFMLPGKAQRRNVSKWTLTHG